MVQEEILCLQATRNVFFVFFLFSFSISFLCYFSFYSQKCLLQGRLPELVTGIWRTRHIFCVWLFYLSSCVAGVTQWNVLFPVDDMAAYKGLLMTFSCCTMKLTKNAGHGAVVPECVLFVHQNWLLLKYRKWFNKSK